MLFTALSLNLEHMGDGSREIDQCREVHLECELDIGRCEERKYQGVSPRNNPDFPAPDAPSTPVVGRVIPHCQGRAASGGEGGDNSRHSSKRDLKRQTHTAILQLEFDDDMAPT